MENKSKKLKLSSNEDEEQANTALNFGHLPVDILLKIFGYLNHKDLCRIGGVCWRFHEIARCPVFWRHVDVQFSSVSDITDTVVKFTGKRAFEAAEKFVDILPPCVTHLRLNFRDLTVCALNLKEFLMKLQKSCPSLEVLIFNGANLINTKTKCSIIALCDQMLANVRVLVFHNCKFKKRQVFGIKDIVTPKLQIIDISTSFPQIYNYSEDSEIMYFRMPNVKKLRLTFTRVDEKIFLTNFSHISHLELLDFEHSTVGSRTFRALRLYGCNLIELYMCHTLIQDDDITFNDPPDALPRLKIICLRGCRVTYKGINSLIQSCPSLMYVFVGKPQFPSLWNNNDYSVCSSKKVQIIDSREYCEHFAKVDYMHA